MNYSFEYIDIILLAMIAGFIFLRLRGILGKRTGLEDNVDSSFPHNFSAEKVLNPSYLTYIIPIIAVIKIKEIVLNAPI